MPQDFEVMDQASFSSRLRCDEDKPTPQRLGSGVVVEPHLTDGLHVLLTMLAVAWRGALPHPDDCSIVEGFP
jgi:hypothetical protein